MEYYIWYILGSFFIFALLVVALALPIIIARWIFRINEQIELLTQIKDELRKSRLKKYPEKREVES